MTTSWLYSDNSWELGNEPNSLPHQLNFTLPAKQLGKVGIILKQLGKVGIILKKTWEGWNYFRIVFWVIWWNHSRTWGSWGFFFKNFLFFPTRRSLDRISMESGNARWGGKVSSVLWSSSISYKVLLSALPGEKTFRAIPPGDGKVCPAIKYLDTVINSAGGMWF